MSILQKRYLKKDAVSTVFPNLTGYFPPRKSKRGSGKATSLSRLQNEAGTLDEAFINFVNQNKLQNYSDLCSRVKTESLDY